MVSTPKKPDPGVFVASGRDELVRLARNSIDFRTGEIWYTAQVIGRMELHFADKMVKMGWKAYTPCERITSYQKRREKGREDRVRQVEFDRPLWSKYSFFAGPHDAIYDAKKTNLLQKIIPDVNQRRLVDQLESLSQQLREHNYYDVPRELESGAWYRLIWPHPFGGYVGQLRITNGRMFVATSIFGDTRDVEIEDAELLERL